MVLAGMYASTVRFNSLPRSSVHMHWISIGNYETGDMSLRYFFCGFPKRIGPVFLVCKIQFSCVWYGNLGLTTSSNMYIM